MTYYALIGGRSIENICNFKLEEDIFNYLNINPKQILFIPLATINNIDNSINKFQKLINNKYNIYYLKDFNYEFVKEKIIESDVIYFNGGCAEELVRLMKLYNLDKLFNENILKNKLIIGISAGAIMLSEYGMGDRYAYKDKNNYYNYKIVKGLGILPITICPHYDHIGLDCYNSEVKNYSFNGYALEDDTAILYNDIKVFKINKTKSVYLFDYKNKYLMKSIY